MPNVDCLHAGMSKKEREDAVTRMRNGESWVMITTEVMARGMDFKGVRGVINYDFPQSVQSYIHRIGALFLTCYRPSYTDCCWLQAVRVALARPVRLSRILRTRTPHTLNRTFFTSLALRNLTFRTIESPTSCCSLVHPYRNGS